MEKSVRYADLEPFIKGSSYNQIFELFYLVGLVRYATPAMLQPVYPKVATKPKMRAFSDFGYLAVNPRGIYTLTEKGKKSIQDFTAPTAHFKTNWGAKEAVHELKVAETIIRLSREPFFFTCFYPVFDIGLRPDACIVWKNGSQAKVQFLEVEEEKGNWRDYLQAKKEKYEQLAKDEDLASKWWAHWCKNFGFKNSNGFCFSVLCVGKVEYGWEGWQFTKSL